VGLPARVDWIYRADLPEALTAASESRARATGVVPRNCQAPLPGLGEGSVVELAVDQLEGFAAQELRDVDG
jgi:hypothetical protein